jgi:hypothetical protein
MPIRLKQKPGIFRGLTGRQLHFPDLIQLAFNFFSGCTQQKRKEAVTKGQPLLFVGVVRLELTTTCTPCKYASQLRHTPNNIFYLKELVPDDILHLRERLPISSQVTRPHPDHLRAQK